ncbi:MAG TPA: prepilin-type N-terminal cleavage/methylation domain-containing protein [Pantanalinema sp.]
MKSAHRPDRHPQRGLTLIEVIVSCLIVATLVGIVSMVGMNSFTLDRTQRGNDLNHFNFSRLTEAFYNDVHSSSALTSKSEKSIRLKKADGLGFVTYQIDPKAVKRGQSKADTDPQQWEELTDSAMFAIASGSFAALKADGTTPATLQDVRRIDIKDLVATLNNNPQSKQLPLLTAFLRSVPAASPAPDSGARYAILSGQSIKFHGNSQVTSSPAGKGNVHANGNLTRDGSSNIDGKVTYAGTSTTAGWHVPASPSLESAVRIPAYTPTQIQALIDAAQAKGMTDVEKASKDLNDSPWNNGKRYATLSGYYRATGNKQELAFTGDWVVTLDGVVYVEGGLNIGGSFTLTGNGIIVCTDRIVTGGNSRLQGTDSSSLALVSLSTDDKAVDTGGSTLITGILFAPNGGMTLNGNTTVNGCLIAGGPMDLATPLVNFDTRQSLSILRATY